MCTFGVVRRCHTLEMFPLILPTSSLISKQAIRLTESGVIRNTASFHNIRLYIPSFVSVFVVYLCTLHNVIKVDGHDFLSLVCWYVVCPDRQLDPWVCTRISLFDLVLICSDLGSFISLIIYTPTASYIYASYMALQKLLVGFGMIITVRSTKHLVFIHIKHEISDKFLCEYALGGVGQT